MFGPPGETGTSFCEPRDVIARAGGRYGVGVHSGIRRVQGSQVHITTTVRDMVNGIELQDADLPLELEEGKLKVGSNYCARVRTVK